MSHSEVTPSPTGRVLVFNHFAVPRSASGGTRHVELFGRLTSWDAQIVAASRSLQGGQRLETDELLLTVPTVPFSGNGATRVINWISYAVAAAGRGLLGPKPTVVWGSSPHLLAAAAAAVVARIRGAKLVVEVRDLWPQILVEWGTLTERDVTFRLLKRLELWLYRRADRIVVLAEGSVDALAADGVDRDKVVFLPNGAEPTDFVVGQDRDSLRSELGFDRFTVLYAGAMGPANGLDFVLDAAAELGRVSDPSTGSNIEIVLLGDGPDRERLASRAADEGLTAVRFVDPVSKDEIPRFLKAADLGLHCLADVELFRHGVSPNKVYDYMAAGLPVLTNTPGVVGDMVTGAGAGDVVEPNDLGTGIRRFVDVALEERQAMGRAGINFMVDHRSRSLMAEQLEALLVDVSKGD